MVTGRPSEYCPETANLICELLRHGQSLNWICDKSDMPDKVTVLRWVENNQEFRNQYAQARLDQADGISDEAFDVVRTEENPNMINAKVNALLAIQARLSPKKYGTQRLGIGQDQDAGPLEIKVIYGSQADNAESE